MPYCIKCGAMLDENALFCAKCGTRVDDQDTAQSTPQQKLEEPTNSRVPQKPTQQDKPVPQAEPKKKSKIGIFAAIAVAAIAVIGAGAAAIYMYLHKDDEQEELIEYASYLKSDLYLFDLMMFERASNLSRDVTLLYVDYSTNGFTTKFGENTEEYFNENKDYYWKMMASLGLQMDQEGEFYQASIDRLMEHGVFTSKMSVDENGKMHLKKFVDNDEAAKVAAMPSFKFSDLIATPAYAGVTLPPVKSGYEFKQAPKKAAKDTRRKLMTVAQQLSGEDLRELFNDLPSDYKDGVSDYKTWWKNLESGKYDKNSYAVMQYMQYVNFAVNPSHSSSTNFQNVAEQLGIDSNKEFVKTAKMIGAAGGNLAKDFNKTWLALMAGASAPSPELAAEYQSAMGEGLDFGTDWQNQSDNTSGISAHYQDKAEIILRRAYDAAVKDMEWKGVKMDYVGASDIIDGIKVGFDAAKEFFVGETDRPTIDWDSKKVPSVIKLMDNDKESSAVMAVVYNETTHEIYSTTEKDKDGNFIIKVYDQDQGKLVVTVYDADGSKGTEEIQLPKQGETASVKLTSDEQEYKGEWGTDALSVFERRDDNKTSAYNYSVERYEERANSFGGKLSNLITGSLDKQANWLAEMQDNILSTRAEGVSIREQLNSIRKAKRDADSTKHAAKVAEQKAKEKRWADYQAKEKAKEEERRRKEEAQKRAEGPGLFETWGNKLRDWTQGKINEFVEMNKTNEEEDDEDIGNVPPKPKDEDQKAREKISGLDENFFLGRWQCSAIAGNGMKLPPGLTPKITVVFNINGTWRGHMEAMNIPGGITIPAYDSSGRYSFDGFNLKYSTGEVFVVTKISENKVVTRDIRSGATATMTRIN